MRLSSPKSGNAPAKRVYSRAFLSNSLEIDYAENCKELFGILLNFPAPPSFFSIVTGAKLAKIREREPTKMNRMICERPIDKSAILRPIGPVFHQSKALFFSV
jgi:hypothetical protein